MKGKGGKGPGVSDHKGHFLGCDGFGGDDEVAFVLAICGVEDDDEFSIPYVGVFGGLALSWRSLGFAFLVIFFIFLAGCGGFDELTECFYRIFYRVELKPDAFVRMHAICLQLHGGGFCEKGIEKKKKTNGMDL